MTYYSLKTRLRAFGFVFLLVGALVYPVFATGDKLSDFENCYLNRSWVWTYGVAQPAMTLQVEDMLRDAGVAADVDARGVGETDACGTFELYAIDFTVAVKDELAVEKVEQQEQAENIFDILQGVEGAKLGNVQITFSQGEMFRFRGRTSQLAELGKLPAGYTQQAVENAASTIVQVDGGLSWQVTGVVVEANETLVVEVVDGEWSSQAGVSPYNNGTGTGYICADFLPPEDCVEPLPEAPQGALIGRIGNHVFEVGSGTTLVAQQEGELALRMNDDDDGLFDNEGVLTVDINIIVRRVQVDSELPWQPANIAVKRNDAVVIEVEGGEWSSQAGVSPYNNGTGTGYICADFIPPEDCVEPLPEAPQGALIGRIGDQVFEVGSRARIVAQQDGELVLRINDGDDGLFDNNGRLTVRVALSSASLERFTSKVYVIVYDPLLSNGQLLSEHLGWYEHESLTQGTVDFFKQVTDNRLNYTVVETKLITDGWPEKVDGHRYSEEEYLAVINGQRPAHQPDSVNYNLIVNSPELDICGKVNRGEIDEVWIYNGPNFGFFESTLVGPGAYFYNSPPVPGPHDCQRLIPIMGPSPERSLRSAVHNFGHRTESALRKVYGSWEQNRTAHNWERFALVGSKSPDYDYSGCGDTHFPPNGMEDYDYVNTVVVDTNCDDFVNYPHLGHPDETKRPVNCSEWGCTEMGYYHYWFTHLPAYGGCGPDEVANNWWKYIYQPTLALDPSSLCSKIMLPIIQSR